MLKNVQNSSLHFGEKIRKFHKSRAEKEKMLTQPFHIPPQKRVGGSRKKNVCWKTFLASLFVLCGLQIKRRLRFFTSRVPDLSPPMALNGFFHRPSELTSEASLLNLTLLWWWFFLTTLKCIQFLIKDLRFFSNTILLFFAAKTFIPFPPPQLRCFFLPSICKNLRFGPSFMVLGPQPGLKKV